jgi:hypothetical protein
MNLTFDKVVISDAGNWINVVHMALSKYFDTFAIAVPVLTSNTFHV